MAETKRKAPKLPTLWVPVCKAHGFACADGPTASADPLAIRVYCIERTNRRAEMGRDECKFKPTAYVPRSSR